MTDVYRIGVSIALANGVSPALAAISRDMLHLHTSVGQIERNFSGWARALGGVGAILVGSTMLGAMVKLTEKAAEFNDQMLKLKMLNPDIGKLVDSGEMSKKSFSLATKLGLDPKDVAKMYGGIFAVIQDTHETEELLPYAAKYARLQKARDPKSHPEESINILVRAGELSGRLTNDAGHIDPQRVKDWFDMAARLQAATHGQVNPQTLLGLAQQGGGISLRGLSQEGFENMAIVSQMMGGQRAGTALLSLRQQMTGKMFSRNAEAMAKYGILDDGEWRSDGGHVVLTDKAKERLTKLVSTDPMGFVNHLIEKMQANGITDRDGQMRVLSEILGRQTTQRMISDMLLAKAQIDRERAGLQKGATIDEGLALFKQKSVRANIQDLEAAWSAFVTALAGPNGQAMISVLQGMTGAVNRMTSAVQGVDPNTLASAYTVIGTFAAVLVGFGAVALVSLLGVPAIITALAAAIGALAILNWSSISAAVGWIEKIPLIGGPIALVIKSIDFLVTLDWKKVGDTLFGIYSAIAGFIDKVISLAGKIGGLFSNPNKNGGSGDSVGSGLNQPMNFNPGAREAPKQQLALSLNIDGRTLAQSVSDEMTSLHAFQTGAASPSGAGRRLGGDHHYT